MDLKTSLPYEKISLTERCSLSDIITGDDITEMHTPYWIFYLATGDKDVESIICTTVNSMLTYLDPGTGLIGTYRYSVEQGSLLNTDVLKQDAEHGGEAPMYSIFPYAWYFKNDRAIASLENFAKTMLECNNDSRYVHFHLYIERRSDGTWVFKDYRQVPANPEAYCDIMEFWWILPTLEAAVVTNDNTLRNRIISRVRVVMDNMISLQDNSTGRIPTVYKMDGSSGYWGKWGLNEAWDPSPQAFSRWIQSSYIMHNLTGEAKYLRSLDKFWDWYFQHWNYLGNPDEYTTMGEYIFHSYYTGNFTYMPKIYEWAQSLDNSESKTLSWMIAKALYYSISGDEEALNQALRAEKEYRQQNFLEYSGHYFYLDSEGHNLASAGNVDFLFRGYISNLILLKNRGREIHGLLYRDLLALGWLLPNLIRKPCVSNTGIYDMYIDWLRGDIEHLKLKVISTNEYLSKAEEMLNEAIKARQDGDLIKAKNYVIRGFSELQKLKDMQRFEEESTHALTILITLMIGITISILLLMYLLKRYQMQRLI